MVTLTDITSLNFKVSAPAGALPGTFGRGDWVVNPTMTTGSATFTIYRLPSGTPFTDLQYRVGAGSWQSIGGTTAGNYAVTGFTDGVQNSITIRAVNAINNGLPSVPKFVTSQTSAALVTGTSSTIVAGGVTWTLSSARPYGVTDTGIVTVDWTPGLQVLSRSPAATTDGGLAVNGTTKNPARLSNQAWHQTADGYSAGAAYTFGTAVADGDMLVGAIHSPGAYASDALIRNGLNTSYSALYFKSGGLPVNAIPPAVIGWSGRGTPVSYALNIADVAASLPSYSLAGMTYSAVADVIARLDRLEIGVAMTANDAPTGYESMLTTGLGGNGNYGRDTGNVFGEGELHLVGDVATAGQKQTLLKSLIRHGVQWFDPIKGHGVVPPALGGHMQFHEVPVAMALHYLGRGTDLDTMHTVAPGNMAGMTFLYTAGQVADLAPHSDVLKPLVSRRRTIPTAGVSGLNITIPTDRVDGLTDLGRTSFVGLQMVRESDGDTAMVTGMPDGTDINGGISTKRVTIDAQPSPAFAQTDVIYFRSPDAIYAGDADWKGRPDNAAINPGYAQDYREINFFTDDVLALRAQGIWRDAWAPWEKYVVRSNQASIPGPGRDYPNHIDTTFARDFWAAHAPTVLGSYPVVIKRVSIVGAGASGTNLTASPAVVSPSTGLTRTYQWYNNGVAIGGATSTTYAVVAGDVGDSITVWETITNSQGTEISRSAPVVGNTSYTINAVNATSDYADTSKVSNVLASTQGAMAFTFRQNGAWVPGTYIMRGVNAAGSSRFLVQQLATNTLLFEVYNAAGTGVTGILFNNSQFNVDTYYTVAISWDNATQTLVAKKRIDGGSWVDLTTSITNSVLNEVNDPLYQFRLATASGGSGALQNCDIHDIWLDFGQKPDFTDSAVLAKFLPTVSKGVDGSLPTGTAPQFFFSGFDGAANFYLNKGLAEMLMVPTGTFTTAGAQPT